ncbi:PucR family transcriptional regulator [Anaerocolumna xylanovorans]|uniref:PucR C-terminal helix-turn-helix domain-containing protein n=1 Tax=Anaerocolumna xylanovorans DSM 12503 TaxID=1121345 RepID=A0A1M7XYI4_9FIRM|nr:helix-turn-helix domain-containing protein [Anaerocolumna xylanovorans]SHO44118.1 PucR C-terminal helix-turn-helix domain-containing protein [Anaerocolumna xylanovorans DSM 12503]
MTFEKLIGKIAEEYTIDILSQGEDIEIQDVALIDNKHDNALKNTLYFGYDKQTRNAVIPSQCILARTDSRDTPVMGTGNAALVTEDSLFSIFNTAKTLIETTRSEGIFEELTALANETRSIEAVIDAASVRLGNFLVFCDMNFKIIASSVSIPVLDPLWKENTVQGYCCYEFISGVKELNSIRNASQTTAAVEVTCSQSPYRKLSSKVFHNKVQIGFLLMIEGENHILPSHFEMLSTISHVISYTIAYYTPELFEENSRYNELLYDMLIGAPVKDITPRLTELHFPSKMLVLFLRPTRYLGQQYLKNNTCKNLKLRIPGTHVTYHKNGMAAVIPLEKDSDITAELSEILADFSKKEYVKIGISHSFTNIEGFVSHFDQAYAALELGQKLKTDEMLCFYQDYQFFDLLSQVKNPENLGRYCHPALAALRQYDHENNSKLYKTLCVYIEKGCNIKLTSESLFIHRNSLVYRLDRITEICNIDLIDINTLFLLRLSFLIDRYNELNTSLEWE